MLQGEKNDKKNKARKGINVGNGRVRILDNMGGKAFIESVYLRKGMKDKSEQAMCITGKLYKEGLSGAKALRKCCQGVRSSRCPSKVSQPEK